MFELLQVEVVIKEEEIEGVAEAVVEEVDGVVGEMVIGLAQIRGKLLIC